MLTPHMKKLVNSVKGKTELPNIKQRSGSTTGRRADTRNRAAPQKRVAPVARLRVLVPQVCVPGFTLIPMWALNTHSFHDIHHISVR